MEPIRVVLADDEAGMRLIERKFLEKAGGFDLIGEAQNGAELIGLVEKLRPQVVFLDVEMPEKTGVECARIIQDMDPSIVLIFATAHTGYMGDAFEVYAFDYLIKPFKMDRVMQTLDRLKERLGEERAALPPLKPRAPMATGGRLMLHHRDGVSFLDQKDILLVQREDRATVIYTEGDGRFVTADSLGDTEARLDPAIFFRCHKSYIINLNRVRDITAYGRWTYIVRLEGTKRDALITHDKYEELQKLFA